MKSFVLSLALCCGLAAVCAEDPQAGMGCKTQGGFEYCEGKSNTYSTVTSDAGSEDTLETRSGGGAGASTYGFTPKQLCDWDDHDKCQQFTVITTPTFMKNSRNQPRYIRQDHRFQQKVQLAICSDGKCGRGKCDQQYATVQLMACEPTARKCRWNVESFRIPSCCKCTNMKFPGQSRY